MKSFKKPSTFEFDLGTAWSNLSEELMKQATEPNMLGYRPHPKQQIFHEAQSYGKWFLGGNRSGKSVAGVVEDLRWVTKRNPYVQIPSHQQIRGRVVGADFVNGIETILFPIFKRWVLPSDLIGGSWEDSYDKTQRTLTFQDTSFIEFRSCDQDLVKHAGTSRHFIHFDEEPPRAFFEENLMRLIDTGFGRWWITMSPIEGMTWMYDDIYEPMELGEIGPDKLTLVEVEMSDNPHLSEEEREKALSFLSADSRKKREKGNFVARGGRVLEKYSERIHYTKMEGWRPPPSWTVYTSLDYGYKNPTAVGWHAVRPDGRKVVTFHEIYKTKTLIETICEEMHKFEADNDITVEMRTGDPNMKQTNGIHGTSILFEYARHGIVMGVEGVPKDESIGINQMNSYLEIDPVTGEPFWEVTQECPFHHKEFRKLAWKTYASPKLDDKNNPIEKVHDKDNHAFDEAKYFFTFMQELSTETTKMENVLSEDNWLRTIQLMATVPGDAHNAVKWDVQETFALDSVNGNDYGWNYGDD